MLCILVYYRAAAFTGSAGEIVMFKDLFAYLRTDDWLDSKVPFMLAIALIFSLYSHCNSSCLKTYYTVAAFFLYISMFLAFSYVINDFTDMQIDKKAGKQKVMYRLPKPIVVVSMAFIFFLGIIPMLCITQEKAIFVGYSLVLYLTGAAYSVHWLLRFKERGLIGLIECSVAQRCLPLVALFFLYNIDVASFSVMIALSFINGLRYILIHQAVDYENDIKTGVRTFVSQGHNKYRSFIISAFILECILFLGIFIRLGMDYLWVLAAALFYVIFEKIIATVVTRYMNVDLFCTFVAVPLEALYNCVFPLTIAMILTVIHVEYLGFVAFLLLLSFKSIKGKLAFISVYAQSKMRRNTVK